MKFQNFPSSSFDFILVFGLSIGNLDELKGINGQKFSFRPIKQGSR
jgi:hypothetical protein